MRSGICSGPCGRRRHLVPVYLCGCNTTEKPNVCTEHRIRWVVRRHKCGIGLGARTGTVVAG